MKALGLNVQIIFHYAKLSKIFYVYRILKNYYLKHQYYCFWYIILRFQILPYFKAFPLCKSRIICTRTISNLNCLELFRNALTNSNNFSNYKNLHLWNLQLCTYTYIINIGKLLKIQLKRSMNLLSLKLF